VSQQPPIVLKTPCNVRLAMKSTQEVLVMLDHGHRARPVGEHTYVVRAEPVEPYLTGDRVGPAQKDPSDNADGFPGSVDRSVTSIRNRSHDGQFRNNDATERMLKIAGTVRKSSPVVVTQRWQCRKNSA
jgi:hypothetical protein